MEFFGRLSSVDTSTMVTRAYLAQTEEVRPGLMLDYDESGKILGIEMLDVSKTADNPRELALEVLASS